MCSVVIRMATVVMAERRFMNICRGDCGVVAPNALSGAEDAWSYGATWVRRQATWGRSEKRTHGGPPENWAGQPPGPNIEPAMGVPTYNIT